MRLLEGKSAIITGSSRGIGRAIAKAFAVHGAGLVIHGTNSESLKPLADELGCYYAAGDIGDFQTSRKLDNAGINARTKFLDLTLEEWDKVLRTNLTGTFYACKCVIPHMLAQKSGVILNMSSRAGKTAHKNASVPYGASKAGIDALTRKLADDFGAEGIRVNSICPGPIETDMSLQWTPDYRQKVFANIPLGRLGRAEEVANLAVFLASDLAGFITGESININGGTYMN